MAAPAPLYDLMLLLDPNAWSKDGTIALSGFAVSDDGKLAAYRIDTGTGARTPLATCEVGKRPAAVLATRLTD